MTSRWYDGDGNRDVELCDSSDQLHRYTSRDPRGSCRGDAPCQEALRVYSCADTGLLCARGGIGESTQIPGCGVLRCPNIDRDQ